MMDFISQNAGVIGLLFFFFVFIGVAAWAFRPSARDSIESHKYIPLNDSEQNQGGIT